MRRRDALRVMAAAASVPLLSPSAIAAEPFRRRRPSDASWPSPAAWERLNRETGGRLTALRSPFQSCAGDPNACGALFAKLKNPYEIGDDPALTQTLGWVDAWTSRTSAYAVEARSARDVAAAVSFARTHDLRLVVKGGGHSYQGTSNAPDSLLIWTRRMNDIVFHDTFAPRGCAVTETQPAVSLGAGCIWLHAYDAVTTKSGKYVQGGGCATVGVAGLICSGGFGSFSKHYGSAASSLLEAEVVTADGEIRIANDCTNSDLFWALKGGGGGTFGAVTRITLRLHELPAYFGGADFTVKAASDDAFRRLIAACTDFYATSLFNDRWGEQIAMHPNNTLGVSMVSYGLDTDRAKAVWQPFFDWIERYPQDYRFEGDRNIVSGPARYFWDAALLQKYAPGSVVLNNAAGAAPGDFWWSGDAGQVGQFLNGYESLWLPATLLQPANRSALAEAFFRASRHWGFSLHFNKGLAGAPAAAIAATRDTATNPAACDAFALAISASEQDPSYPGIPGHEPDVARGRARVAAIHDCMNALRTVAPAGGSYVSESNYFETDWQHSYWGANYARLLQVKQKYDPGGLFFVHHGVGSERWTDDGFTRLQ